MLTVIEVFIFDLAGITELWSALSFIGFGIVLISIGLAYQHLPFGPRSLPAPTDVIESTKMHLHRRRQC
jgi:uncharacterized membrane protein